MATKNTSQTDRFPLIQGVRVDILALAGFRHACDPRVCRHTRCCCKSYEVIVDRNEARTIVGVLPHAAKHLPRLRDEDSFHDPFDTTEGGLCLATTGSGKCVFAFNTRHGLRCSLHAAAMDLGLPPAAVKPKACALWPLFFDETDPPLLTIQEDALQFPCNATRPLEPSLDPGVEEIVLTVFGQAFLQELQSRLRS